MKPIMALIEEMINEIENHYCEPHCMILSWEVLENIEESSFRINLQIDYPLIPGIKRCIILFPSKKYILKLIKRDIIRYVDNVIEIGARLYGY